MEQKKKKKRRRQVIQLLEKFLSKRTSRIIYEFIRHLTQWWLVGRVVARRKQRRTRARRPVVNCHNEDYSRRGSRKRGCAVVSGKMAALPVQKFVTIHHLLPSFDLQIFCRELRELAMHEWNFSLTSIFPRSIKRKGQRERENFCNFLFYFLFFF